MHRTLIITSVLVIALVALLLSLNFNRRQARFNEAKQSLLSQCNNATCRSVVENNFKRCINRYSDDYRDNTQRHPAGILTCMDLPSSDYASFALINVTIDDTPSYTAPTSNPLTTILPRTSTRNLLRGRGGRNYNTAEEASRAFGYGSDDSMPIIH